MEKSISHISNFDFVAHGPNATTLAAMEEAETSDDLETLDLNDFHKFVDSL